jgi:hypothetical protein
MMFYSHTTDPWHCYRLSTPILADADAAVGDAAVVGQGASTSKALVKEAEATAWAVEGTSVAAVEDEVLPVETHNQVMAEAAEASPPTGRTAAHIRTASTGSGFAT